MGFNVAHVKFVGLAAFAVIVTAWSGAAYAGCQGKHIINSNIKTLNFYASDGKTVVASFSGKMADHSLNIEIRDCDPDFFYVVLPNNVPAEVMRTDVGIDGSICEPDEIAVPMSPDATSHHAQGAFDGLMKCVKKRTGQS